MSSSQPPPFDVDRVRREAVAGSYLWRWIDVVQRTGSTNEDLARRARSEAPAGQILVAEHQVAGRGRLGRTWTTTPRSALVFSVLLRPPKAPASPWGWLPLAAALSTHRALASVGADAGIKWPNDLLVNEQKVAGILSERIESREGSAVIVGIGINVSSSSAELPTPDATSLRIAGLEVEREALLVTFLGEFESRYQAWIEGGSATLRSDYLARSCTLGRPVTVEQPGRKPITGMAQDVDDEGRLVVVQQGEQIAFAAADVTHVRTSY